MWGNPPREQRSWESLCYNHCDQTFLMRLQGRRSDPRCDNRADRLISGVYDHHLHSEWSQQEPVTVQSESHEQWIFVREQQGGWEPRWRHPFMSQCFLAPHKEGLSPGVSWNQRCHHPAICSDKGVIHWPQHNEALLPDSSVREGKTPQTRARTGRSPAVLDTVDSMTAFRFQTSCQTQTDDRQAGRHTGAHTHNSYMHRHTYGIQGLHRWASSTAHTTFFLI